MDNHDIYLCTFESRRQSRTEISLSLVFKPRDKKFQIRHSQDYETQAKIEFSYSNADEYLTEHPEYHDNARKAISNYSGEHEKAIKAAMARLKSLASP